MSSVLSSWFYVLTLGIALLLFVALVMIFFHPSLFLELTSASGQLVDLTNINAFNNTNAGTIAATAQDAVIKVGGNSYSIANNTSSILPNAFVSQLPSAGKAAADDVAGAKVTGTFMFWLLMLGVGFLTLLLAFIAIKYPAKLFGPQISALVGCLPKVKSSCESSCSSSCSAPSGVGCAITPVTPAQAASSTPVAPVIVTPTPNPAPAPKPVTQPPAPKPTAQTTTPNFTPQQLAALQQIMAALASAKSQTPTV